ncbi:MAG: thrombospondin type 3 repeat-containing protein, partial [Myxococcota bacterium]|nr:thrombospondin type 3 repeat-containing protein [Myxococcota bacterium]
MVTLLKDHLRVVVIIAGLSLFLPLGACEKAEPPRSNGSTCAANTQCSSALCHFQTCVVPEADDDLDGLVNSVEVIAGTDPLKADTDGDGQGDYTEVGSEFLKDLESSFALDQDKDGTIDALESFLCDTDCDGYSDQNDIRIDTTGQDNNVPMTAIHRPDGCVPICEVEDPPAIDDDEDGVPNEQDNCVNDANADQADGDEDGVGDVCDQDTDNDEVPDDEDNCPNIPNPDQNDQDEDGVGDACAPAPDQDEDGVPDDEDNCPEISNPDQEDEDEDGVGDACAPELDTDEDGVPDDEDNCPDTPNPDQNDADEDGIGDACGEGCGETEVLIDMSFDEDAPGQPSGEWSHAGSSEITSGLEVTVGGAKDTFQCLQLPGDKVSHPDLYGVASSDLRFWFRWDTPVDGGEGVGTAPPDFTSKFIVRAQQAGAQT